MHDLDHLLWGAPDLRDGAGAFAAATGVKPAGGGSHPGFGTRNDLASLGAGVYFEVISPDHGQERLGPRAARLARLAAPRLPKGRSSIMSCTPFPKDFGGQKHRPKTAGVPRSFLI